MSGCDLLDFGTSARQNGKRLPCEHLLAENAKLRELVKLFAACTRSEGCDECPVNGGSYHVRAFGCATLRELMHELGIEEEE